MEKYKFLILGAGPAGLTFANRLQQNAEESFLVLEKEKEAGGLCRSVEMDGAPLDIGGGHILDVARPHVNQFLFEFMPESEWNLFTRNSQINLRGALIDHPIEANIWQLPIEQQIEYIKSIAQAGCVQKKKKPENFIEWINWKLGDKIADDYMLPYNQKMFSKELNQLGTYWLEKLPDVSFEDTLRSCLKKKAYGKEPGHARFYYPKKYGYGEVWLRMADKIKKYICYSQSIKKVDFVNRIVTTKNGNIYQAEKIIFTIPWTSVDEFYGMPDDIEKMIPQLKHNAVEIRYYPDNLETSAHWIYYPDLTLPYHRILVRPNFCLNSRGYWTETNAERTDMFSPQDSDKFCYMNQYAYPLNTIDKPYVMKKLLIWAESNQLYGLGRWGEHQHYNSDVTVERAMNLAEKLIKK